MNAPRFFSQIGRIKVVTLLCALMCSVTDAKALNLEEFDLQDLTRCQEAYSSVETHSRTKDGCVEEESMIWKGFECPTPPYYVLITNRQLDCKTSKMPRRACGPFLFFPIGNPKDIGHIRSTSELWVNTCPTGINQAACTTYSSAMLVESVDGTSRTNGPSILLSGRYTYDGCF